MPSTQVISQSGGIGLVSGTIYSGQLLPIGGIQFYADRFNPSGVAVYIGLPNLSGTVSTSTSGGSLSSGGLSDGMPLYPDSSYFVPKCRLVSGIQTPRLIAAAAASGARVFWELN